MATLWLKNDKKGVQPKKRFMDKRAVRLLVDRKDAAIAEAKRQIKAAEWTMFKMSQKVDDMSEERKYLFFTILTLALLLVAVGVLKLA